MKRRSGGIVAVPGVDFGISEVPLRRVLTRGGKRVNTMFCSRKMGGMVPTESSNELAFALRAELDPTVERVYAQALRIEWRDGARTRHHVPDFVVIRAGRVEVRDVKPDADAATNEVVAVTRQAARWCADRGATYGVDLESVLKAQPSYENAREVAYRLHDGVTAPLARAIVEHVQEAGQATIRGVVASLHAEGCTHERVLTLVARGTIHLDYSRPIDADAVLTAGAVPPPGAVLLPAVPAVATAACP